MALITTGLPQVVAAIIIQGFVFLFLIIGVINSGYGNKLKDARFLDKN